MLGKKSSGVVLNGRFTPGVKQLPVHWRHFTRDVESHRERRAQAWPAHGHAALEPDDRVRRLACVGLPASFRLTAVLRLPRGSIRRRL